MPGVRKTGVPTVVLLLWIGDRASDLRRHGGVIAPMHRAGRVHLASRTKPREVEEVRGPRGQLGQIEKLGPPVPLAEGWT